MFNVFPTCRGGPLPPEITIGRSVTAFIYDVDSDYDVSFVGLVPANHTLILAIIQDQSSTSTLAITGGDNPWTQLAGGPANTRVFAHLCTASEPAAYTVSYIGVDKADKQNITMVEFIKEGGPAIDTSAVTEPSATATQPDVVASESPEMAVLLIGDPLCGQLAGDITNYTSPPAGYTVIDDIFTGGLQGCYTAIAYKVIYVTGAHPPGSWADPPGGSPSNALFTVLLK